MKHIRLLSDYTSVQNPNYLNIIRDGQGDVHIHVYRGDEKERGVRIAASGTRHHRKVREAFYALIEALEEVEAYTVASEASEWTK